MKALISTKLSINTLNPLQKNQALTLKFERLNRMSTPSYPLLLTLLNWKTSRTYKKYDPLQAHEQIIRPLFNASTEVYVYKGTTEELRSSTGEITKPIELEDESILIPKRGKYIFDKTKECITGHEYLWNATDGKRGSIVMVLTNGFDFTEVFTHCYEPCRIETPNVGQSPGAMRFCKEMCGKGIITSTLLAATGMQYLSIYAPNEILEELYRLSQSLCRINYKKERSQILIPNYNMRTHTCYFIKNIPDIIMSKKQPMAGSDVDGLLSLKNKFFGHLTWDCEIHEVTLHLFISYSHEKPEGKKLDIGFAVCGGERDIEKIEKHFKRPSSKEDFILQKDPDRAKRVESQSFTAACTLTKHERKITLKPDESAPAQQGETVYFVSPWDINEDARLIDMIHTMESLSEDSAYRVDIFPNLTTKTREDFREAFFDMRQPLHQRVRYPDGRIRCSDDELMKLRELLSSHNAEGSKQYEDGLEKIYFALLRDHNAVEALKQYENWLQKTYSQSMFQVNIYAFGSNARDAQLLLHAAASEALQKSEYTVLDVSSNGIDAASDELYPSNFGIFHGFPFNADAKAVCYKSEDFPNPIKFWPTLFTDEEIAPFFPFLPVNLPQYPCS
jgi:hypothetical protein